MGNLMTRIKSSKFVNHGLVKKIKDKIYFKYIDPKMQAKTDLYRTELLQMISEVLSDATWMLSCGGFLRFYRDHTMDGQDLDILVLKDDLDRLIPDFIKRGFTIKQVFYKKDGILTEYRMLYKDAEVDFFAVFKEGKKWCHYFTLEDNTKEDVTIKRVVDGNRLLITGEDYITYKRMLPSFDMETYHYDGVAFKGPKNPREHLTFMYGETWEVYDPHFNPRTQPENNRPIPHKGATSIVFEKPVLEVDLKL